MAPIAQAEVMRSPFPKAFESQRVEINPLLSVGCFTAVDEENITQSGFTLTKKTIEGSCVKTKSRLVAKGFSQEVGVYFYVITSPTPASAPITMIAAVANEKGLPVYHPGRIAGVPL